MDEQENLSENKPEKKAKKRRKYTRKPKGQPPVAITDTDEPKDEAPMTDRDDMHAVVEPETAPKPDPIREDLDPGIINMGSVLPTTGSLPDPAPGETKEPKITMQKVQPRQFFPSAPRARREPLPVLTLSKLRSLRKG